MAPRSPGHRDGCARLNVGRLNAFRLNVYEPIAIAILDGVNVSGGTLPNVGLRIEGATIEQVLNEQTDTASFRAAGFVPVAGQRLDIYSGGLDVDQLFGGPIIETTRLYESKKENEAFDLHCVDPTWLLGRRLVLAHYLGQSATIIVQDLVARFTRGVTGLHVAAGLPVIDEITFTNESVPVCFTAICERIGGNWYLDYDSDLHVFLDETPDANPITDANPRQSADFALTEDLSQVVTYVIGRGGGEQAAIDVPIGADELPVEEGAEHTWYATSGGQVEIGTQVVNYSGVRGRGGRGAFVGTGNAPSAAPVPTPMGGATHQIGATYGYAATFTTAAGETLAGPIGSITITQLPMQTPAAVTARSRGPGSYPPGMISPAGSPIQFAVQIWYNGGAVGPGGTPSAAYNWDGHDWEVYLGPTAPYRDGYYFPLLEPNGPVATVNHVAILRSDNFQPWMFVSSTSFASGGGWYYQCCVGYATGGSAPYPTTGFGSVLVKAVPVSNASGVTGRKLYRTIANGTALKLLTTIANNTAVEYGDTIADAALGAAPPTADTSGVKDEGQVLPGSMILPVSTTTPFSEDVYPTTSGGWVRVGALPVRYTAIGSGVLTGIPATGNGSLTAAIRYGTQVLVQPRLWGIPPVGYIGAIVDPIRRGDQVTIRVERQNVDAVSAMAWRLKPYGQPVNYEDGIIQLPVSDSRFTYAELLEHVEATLLDRKDPKLTVTFTTRDTTMQVGRLVTVNLTKPAINGTFRIQRISFSEIAISGGLARVHPLRRIEASNKLYKFTDLLRRLRSVEGGVR